MLSVGQKYYLCTVYLFTKMLISLIAAATLNDVIGKSGAMPWHLPDDLRYFKQMTLHHHVIMGRKTFEEFGLQKPLPKRTNIIVSRRQNWQIEGCVVGANLHDALAIARNNGETEAFIIGGGQIYKQALPICDRIYLTRIEANLAGDTFFPTFSAHEWHEISSQRHEIDDKHAYPFEFKVYERITKPAGE